MIQLGAHPNAESLTAFAEQLLSGAERTQILAHMAACSRCREVVFLAQQAMEADRPAQINSSEELYQPTQRGWFARWQVAWIPVAALAGFIGFAVVQHLRREVSPPQIAQNVAPQEKIPNTTPAKALSTPSIHQQPHREEPRPSIGGRGDRDEKQSLKALDEEDKTAQKKDELAKESDLLSAAAPTVSGGTVTARAKSATGGPMAQNQVQQQNNAQLQQQNYSNEVRQTSSLSDSANKDSPASVQPGRASGSITVHAEGGSVPAPAAPVSAPDSATAPSRNLASSDMKAVKLKAEGMALPSELGILSEATVAKTTIAIDTAGSLFLIQYGDNRWQPVKTQWTGRAVMVKARSTNPMSGDMLRLRTPQFGLTTDKMETWVSEDGKTWTLETQMGK